jgi:hypothetical protein
MVSSPETIPAAFEAGINFFLISADMHWPRYEPTRVGLAQLLERVPREQIVVAAVSYVTQPEFCELPFREVIEAIPGLRFLDVLVAGGAYAHELESRLPVYQRHRRDHLVGARALGVSFHDRRAATAAINRAEIDLAFVRYNTAHPGAQRDVFPLLAPVRDTRVFGFTSTHGHRHVELADDIWVPDITDHYRFALSRPELDGLLCSPTEPAHVADLVAAMERGALSPEEEQHMIELAASYASRSS